MRLRYDVLRRADAKWFRPGDGAGGHCVELIFHTDGEDKGLDCFFLRFI
jgi:hypothetical protein